MRLMSRDELFQTAGIVNVLLLLVVILKVPQVYWVVHVISSFVYLPWRFVRFSRDNCELYMLDFCYMATYITVVGCMLCFIRVELGYTTIFHQWNNLLIRAGFTFSGGSLAWSVVIFKNSLVFYNIDQMTSVFIHLSPAVFFWCLRWGGGYGVVSMEEWWPGYFDICPGADMAKVDSCLEWPRTAWCDACPAHWADFTWKPAIVYMVAWAVPYALLIFGCLRGWIERSQKETLYSFILGDSKKSAYIRALPEALWPLGYMMQHFAVNIILGVFTMLFWHSFLAHTIFGVLVIVACIHNGSTYTFRVFGINYARDLLAENASAFEEGSMCQKLKRRPSMSGYEPLAGTEAGEDPEE